MDPSLLASLADTHWTGNHELWLDGLGDAAETGPCSMAIAADRVCYTWQHHGTQHSGEFAVTAEGARWSDTFHQPTPVACPGKAGARGILALEYSYPAPPGPDWDWRIVLAQRPGGELVLQMTNIAPWGEEARAVRMVFTRDR